MVAITFIKGGVSKKVDAEVGKTLLQVAEENQIELVGACGGSCACGSCHVYIDEETLKKIEPAKEEEEDVLDIVFNLKTNSRLACQVVVSETMEGALITIPE